MGGNDSQSTTNFVKGEKSYMAKRGKDRKGITEYYQLHDTYLENHKKIKLSETDMFFREAFRPMHLMNFEFFNNNLDRFLIWC